MTKVAKFMKPKLQLPPVKVEPALLERIKHIASVEQRTISEVVRCALRDGLGPQEARVELALEKLRYANRPKGPGLSSLGWESGK